MGIISKGVIICAVVQLLSGCTSYRVPPKLTADEVQLDKNYENIYHDLNVGVYAGQKDCRNTFVGFGQYEVSELLTGFIMDLAATGLFKNVSQIDAADSSTDLIIILTTCRPNKYCGTPAAASLWLLGLMPIPSPPESNSQRFIIMNPKDSSQSVVVDSKHDYSKMLWWFSPILNISRGWSWSFNKQRYLDRLRHDILLKSDEIIKILEK